MANSFQLIEKYLTNVVDTVFMEESKTNILVNGSKFVKFDVDGTASVKILDILMDGLSDYYRANDGTNGTNYSNYPQGDGYKQGNSNTKWNSYDLKYDRGKQFKVDNMDNEEEASMIIGNLLTEFLRTKVIPEVDEARFSRMASKCSSTLGNLVSETISANKIISKFNDAFTWLKDREVPEEEQVIYVNPTVMNLIRNTTELEHRLSQADFRSADGVTFKLQAYEGRPIIEVPSNRFFTNVTIGDNGFYAGSTSKLINFIICSKKAIVPIVKLSKTKIFTPEVVQDFDGYKINFRLYHDAIVPKNKVAGVYTSVSETDATTKTNILSVNVVKTTGGYSLEEYFTTPAGLMGTVVYSTTALAVGATYTAGDTNKVITENEEFTKVGSETKAYFVLVDSNNTVIATSGEVTLPTE